MGSEMTIHWYEAGGTTPLMSGTYIDGNMYDPTQGVYVTASYNGVEYGMGSGDAIFGSSDAGGSSDPNYANQLYVQGYHPETDEYRNYYLDDASGSADTLADLTGIQGLHLEGQLYNPDGGANVMGSEMTIHWYEAGGTTPLMSGNYINSNMYDPTQGVYVTASYNGVEYGMGSGDAIFGSSDAGGSSDDGNTDSGDSNVTSGNQSDYTEEGLTQLLVSGETLPGDANIVPATNEVYIPGQDTLVIREAYEAFLYDSGGSFAGSIDLDGSENTFVFDASTDFDFFGYSYDPSYTDDSEVVVLQGVVNGGTRSIELGESFGAVEDWDVVSFDGLSSGVSIDLSTASLQRIGM